jgi:hypothetical protein
MIQLHVSRASGVARNGTSVPAQRVFCHDRSGDLLGSYAAAVTAAAASAAATAWQAGCQAPIASARHPGVAAQASNRPVGVATAAGNGAGSFVGQPLLPVPACDEEHGSTISQGTNDSTRRNANTGPVDGPAGTHVTADCTTLTRSIRCAGLRVIDIVGIARLLGAVLRE